jgi:2-amino-4-hydroxy-6-hydroxymethyldihydropteridine diphosphokinase
LNATIPTDVEDVPVYLTLGSNIAPETNLPQAIKNLNLVFGVAAQSSIWQTPAVGFEGEDFLNAVVLIYTPISANTLRIEVLRPIEALLGRVRKKEKFIPRTIDIDILLHQDELLDEELWAQPHLAVPLAEIYPGYKREATGETLEDIANSLRQNHPIKLWEYPFNQTNVGEVNNK